jgi:hypothetical protein
MPNKDETPTAGTRRRQRAEAEPPPAEPAAAGLEAETAAEQPPDPAELERLRARLIAQNRIARYRGRGR